MDVRQLAAADRTFDNLYDRLPAAADVVQVLDDRLRFVRHDRLGALPPSTRVCFQGRVYRLQAGTTPDTLALTDTGMVLGRVVHTFRQTTETLLDLTVRAHDGTESVISGTPEHPVYVPAVDAYLPMNQLTPGTTLTSADGNPVTVVESATGHGSFDVYNFEVEGQHNYYASIADVLVHNMCAAQRPSSKKLRLDWEKENGIPWPREQSGRNYDVSHRQPRSDGGSDNVDNIFPERHADHMNRHTENGDFRRWGKRGKP